MVTVSTIKLVFVRKIEFVYTKFNRNCCHQSCTLGASMHQIVCRLGLRPDPTGEAHSAPDIP